MKKYVHDTNYYNFDIVKTITDTVKQSPDLNVNGVYAWSVFNKDNTVLPIMIYYNSEDNDKRGMLLVQQYGSLKAFIGDDSCVLDLNKDTNDCTFSKSKVIEFIKSQI